MPSNIEIKARVADLLRTRALAVAISDTAPMTLRQRDTFFQCVHGRLKLREGDAGECELIFYDRADVAGTRQSDYEISTGADAESLKGVLQRALGATHVVEKTRMLCFVGQTRVHLDSVSGLGDFLELEVVLRPGQSPDEGHAIAADLMRRLEIDESDLIAAAYADLLAASGCDDERTTSGPTA